MAQIQIAEIKIGNRYRRDMGDIHSLADSMNKLGLLQPVGVDESHNLLWGHRRVEAARFLGWETIEAKVADVDGLLAEHDENEVRKDFTVSERVEIGKAIEARVGNRQGQRTDRLQENFPEVPEGVQTRDIAAQKAGFGNPRTYEQAKQVTDRGAPELVDAMDSGKVSISAAATIAERPKEEQQEIVARGEREILAASKEIRARKAEEHRERRIEKIVAISKSNSNVSLADIGAFPIILCDPPWRYEHIETESRAIENQYPTMSLDDICGLPINQIALSDAVLFLWATSPKLEESFRVLTAWGFNYRTCAVWDKEVIGMGYYFRQRHELLLVATRGNIPAPLPEKRVPSVFQSRRSTHSTKPEIVYEIIEGMYPELPKLEMFCRKPREGWSVWGNQV